MLLLFNAGPLNITWAKYSDRVHVIMECFFPAQAAGDALYNVMYNNAGAASNPAGRLPVTWPASLSHVPNITDYSMKERTYRYSTSKPLYPFGYGLSYTSFVYSDLSALPAIVRYTDDIKIDVYLMNKGKVDGDEVRLVLKTQSTMT